MGRFHQAVQDDRITQLGYDQKEETPGQKHKQKGPVLAGSRGGSFWAGAQELELVNGGGAAGVVAARSKID
jgi:hypothetical protein